MSNTFGELMQEYVNKSREELIDSARFAVGDILSKFPQSARDNVFHSLLDTACFCLAIDGSLDRLEYSFFNEVFPSKLSESSFVELIEKVTNEPNFGDKMAKIVSVMQADEDIHAAYMMFVICMCACNETISKDEVDIIKAMF